MILYIDKDSRSFINEPKFKTGVSSVSFMRGDNATVNLVFVSGTTSLSATNDKNIRFGVKKQGEYDGNYVVYTDEYTTSGVNYVLSPSFNTSTLNSLLSSGDGTTVGDIPSITLMLQVEWSEDSDVTVQSTNIISCVVNNDLIKGTESSPTELPTPYDWMKNYSNSQQALSSNFAVKNATNTFTQNQVITGSLTLSAGEYNTPFNIPLVNEQVSIGREAGNNATNASYSNFFGFNAGSGATNASNSNFLGAGAGNTAEYAYNSNFLGSGAGAYATNASYSNFLGSGAGYNATNASYSNFFGNSAGSGATIAYNSNFFGFNAGYGATDASDSNFFGQDSGAYCANAYTSNFFGLSAGYSAALANDSNFFGQNAGSNAYSASNSNFLGGDAGNGATAATGSNFLGSRAGLNATTAEYSNFLGYMAGANVTGSRNQLIGANTTVIPLSCSNCIVLGDGAVATQSNTIAIGSTATPLLTAASGTSTGSYLVVRINGVDMKLPLYI